MGQKVNPNGLRIGISRPWTGQWYADRKKFAETLKQDIDIRRYLEPRLKDAGLSRIDIKRTKSLIITCFVQFSRTVCRASSTARSPRSSSRPRTPAMSTSS